MEKKEIKLGIEAETNSAKEKISELSKVLGEITDGFTAAKNIAEIFGIESDKISKIIDKVSKAQKAYKLLQDDTSRTSKKSTGEIKEGGKANEKLAGSLSKAASGFKTLLKVMSANVIGAIITLVATLATYWDDIKEAVNGVSSAQKNNLKIGADLYSTEKKRLEGIEAQENILKQGGKSEREILELKKKQLSAIISAGEADIQNQENILKTQIEAERRNKEILKGFFDMIGSVLKPVLNVIDGIGMALGKDWNLAENFSDIAASQFFDPDETAKEGEETIQAARDKLTQFKDQKAALELSIKGINEKSLKERQKQDEDYEKLKIANMEEGRAKELAKAELKYQEDQKKYKGNKKALEELEKLHKKSVDKINSDWDEKERKTREDARNKIFEDNKKWVQDDLDNKRKSLEKEFKLLEDSLKKKEITEEESLLRKQNLTKDFYAKEKTDLATHYDELLTEQLGKLNAGQLSLEEYDAIKKGLNDQKANDEAALKLQQEAAEKELDTAIANEKEARLKEQAEKEKAIRKAKWDFAEKITNDGMSMLDLANKNLVKNAKTQNDIEKAITLVKIGIDSAKAISNAIAMANAPTPDNVATGGIAGIAKFAAISAQIAVAVAQAHKVLSTGVGAKGGGSVSSSPAAPSISAPQISAPQLGGTQILSRQHSPEPLKVFVTEADIRRAQQKVKVIEGQSVVV